MVYKCEECEASFPKLSQMLQHRRTENHWEKYTCPSCKKTFTRKNNLVRHMKKHADENNHHCPECLKVFTRRDALDEHFKQHDQVGGGAVKRPIEDKENDNVTKRQKLDKNDNPNDFYDIRKVSERKIEKFKTSATYYNISVKDIEFRDLSNILKSLKILFQSIIDKVAEDIPSNDLVRVSMDNPELDFPIVLPFMRRSALTVERILTEIERVLQSYEQFVVDETFGVELVHVQTVKGSGYKMKPVVDIANMLEKKKSIIQIKNKDQLCCARALVTAMARVEKHPQWNSIRQGRQLQKELAVKLHESAKVPPGKCGIDEIKTFQTVVTDYQIHVLSKEHFNAIVYSGPEGGVPIYLYHHDGHYDVITKITGFLNRSYFCDKCKKGYQHKERHSCNNPCHFCHQLHTDDIEDWQYCQSCSCNFVNQTCFSLHLKKTETGKSTCDIYYRCQLCKQLINRLKHKNVHVCGEKYCQTCKEYFEEGHQCYMQQVDNDDERNTDTKKKQNNVEYIFFDFECTQDSRLECQDGYLPGARNACVNCRKSWCGSMEHQPNLCVVQKVCKLCMNNDQTSLSECVNCGSNERVFSGPNTVTLFCKWLFSKENTGATCICHNFKGYDSYPILRYLHNNAILPEVITTGSKYMSIKVPFCKIKFIDSLNFIPMPLAEMPKAFGETEIAKGYFPHLFNRKENQTVVLPHLPDIKYYNSDGMKPEFRSKFNAWYKEHCNEHFDFKMELIKYCRSDVDILRKCCLKFRSLFMDLTRKDDSQGIDPFEKCITIASACNLVFRTNFLEHESIGIIPPHGYTPHHKQSAKALQWIKYLSYTEGHTIQHAQNGGEKSIGPYLVDGYYETENEKVVLEFHGDFWHGNPSKYARTTVNPVNQMTMGELHDNTLEKRRYLENMGFTYKFIWESDFDKEVKDDPKMRTFIEQLDIVTPLEPRDAFYGGRTEAFKLYEEATEDKQIKYYDVTSLYPYINKTGKIPQGHPTIITEKFTKIDNYEGLIKCKVLPPRGLYIPVLPAKCNGKLMFSLCRTCGENYQSGCTHSEFERAFLGTWVTDELKTALANGYKLLNIYEVWHFDNISQYDPVSKTGGLFTGYVNTFLKVKQEASGWPDWCKSKGDKQMYIKQYFDKEGILLEYDNIKENPGLRLIAKLTLNSFWGKFGQRSNLTQTTYIDDPEHFMDMMTSDNQEIKNIRFVSDEAVQLDWAYSSDFIDASSRTNVVIAAYTTAQARLKLYSHLKPLGNRALYCDTDSIVFTVTPGQCEPSIGDYLGDLTDEAYNNSITKFVTGGPKNYAYTLLKPNKKEQTSICKVRGITLNFKNALGINFDTLKGMVTDKSKVISVKVIDENKITRNPDTCHIISKTETKDYRIVFDKRVISKDFYTFPYGM